MLVISKTFFQWSQNMFPLIFCWEQVLVSEWLILLARLWWFKAQILASDGTGFWLHVCSSQLYDPRQINSNSRKHSTYIHGWIKWVNVYKCIWPGQKKHSLYVNFHQHHDEHYYHQHHLHDYYEVVWHFKVEMEMAWLKFQFQHFSESLAHRKHLLCNLGSHFFQAENGLNKTCWKISPGGKPSKIKCTNISEFGSKCQVRKTELWQHKTDTYSLSITGVYEVLVSMATIWARVGAKSFICTILGVLLVNPEK